MKKLVCLFVFGMGAALAAQPTPQYLPMGQRAPLSGLQGASVVGKAVTDSVSLNVTAFGAVGDCTASGSTTSCTDNHAAIQAAVNAAYAVGGSVYFPFNLSNTTGQTVYYTSLAINSKGVSLYGPPGASGPFQTWATDYPVVIRGAPSQDVFSVVDIADAGYVQPHDSFSVRDLTIFVDGSVDASASFPNRKPGRTVMDGAITTSNHNLTSATAEFQPGDVGQAVSIGGAGSIGGGSPLVTWITQWTSPTSVQVNNAALNSVTNATTYISAMNLPVTATIGNCAFAYPDRTGAFAAGGPTKSEFEDVSIMTINPITTPTTCGFFFQGNESPSWVRWSNVSIGGASGYGFAFVPASAAAPSSSIYTGIKDYNLFDNVYIFALYPFLVYSGELHEIRHMQIFTPNGTGPQFINAFGTVSQNSNWKIDIPEMEAGGACLSSPIAFRISGVLNQVKALSVGTCVNGVIQWDASSSTVDNLTMGSYAGTVAITGNNNKFAMLDGADTLTQKTLSVTGWGNTLTSGTQWNAFLKQPARVQYANPGLTGFATSPFGNTCLSRGAVSLNRNADFLSKGGSAYFFNNDDLWLWPQEIGDSAGGGTGAPLLIADSTAESCSSFAVNTTTKTNQYISESDGASLYIGSQVPAGKLRIYFRAKAASATNMTVGAQAGVTSLGSTTASLTTTYAVNFFDVDVTAYAGSMFILNFASVTAAVQVDWIGIRPWDSDAVATSLTLGSGAAMTANQGNGTAVQHSTGSLTNGHMLKADANGNSVDGGAAASAVVTAVAPTVGQAACIKSLGPPILIGYCSTTPTSGTCTCN